MRATWRARLVMLAVLAHPATATAAPAQTVRARSEAIRYSFDDPTGVGLESLDLSTASFGAVQAVTPSIDVGLTGRWA